MVEAEVKGHRPTLQGPRGLFTPWYHRLSLQSSQSYKVCFCYLAYE